MQNDIRFIPKTISKVVISGGNSSPLVQNAIFADSHTVKRDFD